MKGVAQKRAKLGSTGVFAEAPAAAPTTAPAARPDRVGRVAIPFWATAAARRQLRMLAAERDTTQQALLTEALNDLFRKHEKPPIA
ncbi:MAG: ribbon-helix-helix domain-containing protein [Acetobacteraceae bacterium]